MTGTPLRLGILVTHPIQYFAPLFRELAGTPGVDLVVMYRTKMGVEGYYDAGFDQTLKWDVPLLEGHPHIFLSDRVQLSGIQWRVVHEVLRRRFDALVVHGYASPTEWLAILACKLAGTRVLMRGDTRLMDSHRARGPVAWLKRWIFRRCDGLLAVGSLNRQYYLAYGVAAERIHRVPFSVLNAQFALPASEAAAHRASLRKRLGAGPDAVVLLFASKLLPRKRAGDLIAAYALIQQDCPGAWLAIVGSGAEEPALRDKATDLGLERVRFLGFVNQGDLPAVFAASDVFVMPAEAEAWGLVVNEAMAAGLPVVVSDQVGAAPDLVQGRGTGIVFPCGDVPRLAAALRTMVEDPVGRRAMGDRARGHVGDWDVQHAASALVSAARATLQPLRGVPE